MSLRDILRTRNSASLYLEFEAREKQHRQNLETIIGLKNVELESLRARLEETQKERDFYREELFKLKGIGTRPIQENAKEEPELQPTSHTREPWPLMKRRLEREDREKLAESQRIADAQAQAIQDHWEKKNLTNALNEEAKKVN